MKVTDGAKVFIKNTKTGRYLFFLRDNKPTIPNPNRWGLLGGGMKSGETPIEALKRELQEETNINTFNIKQIGKKKLNPLVQGRKYVITGYYFIAETDTPPDKMILNEGQKLGYFSLEEIQKMENVSPSIPKLIKEYKLYIR